MKTKKLLSLILSAVMLCGTFLVGTTALAAEEMPFTDVKASDWFYESVKYAYNNSLMEGTGGTTFSPAMKLSRAQFVTILGRMAGAEKVETSTFPDVEANSWYSGYVGWAVNAGIVKGLDNGTFGVNDPVTREMAAVMVNRYVNDYKKCNITTRGGMYNFNDADKVSAWAADSIAVLRNSGVVEGDQNRNFNPRGNMSRSEAAAIFMRLDMAIKNAWNGYLPDTSEDSVVYGASYLYRNGTAAVGGMGQELDTSGDVPVMKTRLSRYDATYTYHHPNTTGVSINYLEIDVTKTPYVKVAFKNGMDGTEIPETRYVVNKTRTEKRDPTVDEVLTLTPGADDSGFKTATIDLTVINEKYPSINYSVDIANLLFYPCTADYAGEGTFDIAYIAFFSTQAAAEKFTIATADADVKEYIKSYEPYSDLNWNEFTADDEASYDKLIADRIHEIKTSESAVTPEDVKAAGGAVYYVSSINGSDENDGLSPETPYKSTAPLYYMLGPFEKTYLKKGDGVFFERGTEYYPETYHDNSMSTLSCEDGVTYGAYGTGDKPLFTMAMDFRDTNGVGVWKKTEWKNVYVLENIADEEYWWGHRSEIGNIFFNGGEAIGVRIIVDGNEEVQYLGEGQKSTDRGYCGNGYEYFYSPVRDLTNPGTALKNDLEFFHDYNTGKLYLYSKDGNPADRFDDIKVSRSGTAAWASGGGARYDNLAFMYCTTYAARAGSDITFTNCEIGCVGGSLSSVESGVEIYGETDGAYFYNNYIHDVGDGGLTSQGGALIQNIEYIGNVMVACGHSAEIWSGFTVNDDGTINERINNVLIKDNIMAYNGYGMRTKQDRGSYSKGETICGSMYGEYSNCIAEGNLYYKGQGSLYTAYVATYDQPRGWMAKGNTYVCNTSFMSIGYIYETLNHIDHRMWKRARVDFPFNYETLVWYTGLGVDPKGTYYYYDDVTDAEDKNCFFMTGYYVENGGFNK